MSKNSLERLTERELSVFRSRLQTAFFAAVIEKHGSIGDEPVLLDKDVNDNFYSKGAKDGFFVFEKVVKQQVVNQGFPSVKDISRAHP